MEYVLNGMMMSLLVALRRITPMRTGRHGVLACPPVIGVPIQLNVNLAVVQEPKGLKVPVTIPSITHARTTQNLMVHVLLSRMRTTKECVRMVLNKLALVRSSPTVLVQNTNAVAY